MTLHRAAPRHGASPWADELEAMGLLEVDYGVAELGNADEPASVAEEYYLGLTDAGRVALRAAAQRS